MRKSVILLVLLMMTLSMAVDSSTNAEVTGIAVHQNNLSVPPVTPVEAQGVKFLKTKMLSPDGLIYYLVEYRANSSYSVLESIGQAMEYWALIGDKDSFELYAQITDQYYRDPTGYYYWKVDVTSKTGDKSSALVDDLRVAKAYFTAEERNLGSYKEQMERLSEFIYAFDVNADGYPCDYYDGELLQKADEVSLFYLDVETLKKLSKFNNKWLIPYNNATNILLRMPENKYGFYPKTYVISTQKYVWSSSINMVENLYTAIDAYYAGKNTHVLAAFLKKQVKKGKIYNHYNLDGKPVDENESTAVYALAACFLALNHEAAAADWCYHRTTEFQIKDGEFAGGFGDTDTGTVYAFDQLEALIMFRTVEAANVNR